MTKQMENPISESKSLLTPKGGDVLSCKSNVHPKFGTEYSCIGPKGEVYINKELPPEKIFNEPFRAEKNTPILGKRNQEGDLLLNPELTNGKSLIIKKKDLWTDLPPKGSIITKLDPISDAEIIVTPEGVWISKEIRMLDHDETMKLIIKRLQQLEAKERPIGRRSSIDTNMETLALRTGYASDEIA